MECRIRKFFAVAAVSLSVCVLPLAAHADEDSEREALAKIAIELHRLEQEVRDAGHDATSATRIKFRYDWLARDLALIRSGVETHLDAPRQPRPAPPLKGEYRD